MQIRECFKKTKIYIFDRDKCRIFENMSQSVALLMCITKDSTEKEGIFTSRMFREMPLIDTIESCNSDNYLLPRKSTYQDRHRLPKIGERINLRILEKLFSFSSNISNILNNSNNHRLWIRTSGNYWYNAFDKKPYDSSEISEIYVDRIYKDFFLLAVNSSLFYFWVRVYGDGRHMNRDIMEEFPIPSKEVISHNLILIKKIKERFMQKLYSVFESERKRFRTSEIKDEIDLIDLVIGRKFYNLEFYEIVHIINYDWEVRGGNKLNNEIYNLVNKIRKIQKHSSQKTNFLESQIDQLVYELYNLTPQEIPIIEGNKNDV